MARRLPPTRRASFEGLEKAAIVQFLIMLILAGMAFSTTLPEQSIGRLESVLVRFVVDGDTLDVVGYGRIRLLGIDAPELGRGLDTEEPFAREAQQRLAGLVLHRWVRLEHEDQPPLRDAYRRRLAYVVLETGTFVNAVMVRDGLARVTARRTLRRLGELQQAEASARAFRRGIWGAWPVLPPERYVMPRKPRSDRR